MEVSCSQHYFVENQDLATELFMSHTGANTSLALTWQTLEEAS